MPQARQEQVNISDTPYYHCISRCVRRAFLCGHDYSSGQNFDHRKLWLEDRLRILGSVFAVDICAYAILSNHFHLVLRINTEKANTWTTKEVAERWQKLFKWPVLVDRYMANADLCEVEKEKAEEIIEAWRLRLADISWFMRCTNEPIARMANKEDKVTGRFWEGRFKSQALLDETAVLACMAYVDLNPVRAGISETLEKSDFTSIQTRLFEYVDKLDSTRGEQVKEACEASVNRRKNAAFTTKEKEEGEKFEPIPLMEFAGWERLNSKSDRINFRLKDYFELVDWTGRAVRDEKKGAIPEEIRPILQKLGVSEQEWLPAVNAFRKYFMHCIGNESALNTYQENNKKRRIRGRSFCLKFYSHAA